MNSGIQEIRIFLSSPGDVTDERGMALQVIERINNEHAYRSKLKINTVAWEKPGSGTAMPAHLEPQDAIKLGMAEPSQCDLVVVIFWSRMGTPLSEKNLKPDGSL
ncbi:MAG: SIR2 family protein, partial [Candidatus Competibacteraceae bacterium]|nr:SIR2 family protein [Candidatus Competibacteraceae bacterium]